MPVTSYSLTPGSNNSAPPNGAPEGWSPADVNNTVRQIMTDIAVEAQINAVKVLASVAGTNTITGSMTPDLTTYGAGMTAIFIPANTNTGAVTLNIDSLGAQSINKEGGVALVAGDLVAGVPALVVHDGGIAWYLQNPQTAVASTYTPTVTAIANVSSVGTVETHRYQRIGSIVTVFGAVNLTITSGAVLATVSITLPITSNLGAATDVAGSGSDTTNSGRGVYVYANAATDTARAEYFPPSSGITKIYYQFSYTVI